MKIDSVLVVLDKPKHDQLALERARLIAQRSGAALHIVSFAWLPVVEQHDMFDAKERRSIRRTCLAKREQWMAALVADLDLDEDRLSSEAVWTNDIAGWVLNHTADHGYGLVVKTAHHSKTVTHTPLDWQLLQRCTCAVLLVSNRRRKDAKHVLAALDLRHTDRRHTRLNGQVLAHASLFAELLGGKLHCVNAVEYSEVLHDLDLLNLEKRQADAAKRAKVLLKELVSEYELPRTRLHQHPGKVGQVVEKTAHKVNAGLVVIGTSAHRRLGEVLLGNSAEKVLGRVTCDVLAVHP